VGVATGIILKICMHVYRGAKVQSLVRPTLVTEVHDTEMRIVLKGAGIFTTLLKVRKVLEARPSNVRMVILDVRDTVLVDHTFIRNLRGMADEWASTELVFEGLENLEPASDHPLASRRKAS